MPRRKRKSFKREIGTDVRFNSEIIQKFINVVMKQGKKSVARSIIYGAMDELIKKHKGDEQKALEFFNKAFNQVIPVVQVKPRRVGGSVYQIPVQVSPDRGRALAFNWIIDSASRRPNKTMSLRLAHELMDAYEDRGGAIKKKTDVHKMAEANRAFSHYAW